jgi:hypothetical protein
MPHDLIGWLVLGWYVLTAVPAWITVRVLRRGGTR